VLDYAGDTQEMGKNLGDDLREGKCTLPLIAAMQRGTAEQAAIVRAAIEQGSTEQLATVVDIVRSAGALDVAREAAHAEARRAIDAINVLPANPHTASLLQLASQLLERRT
jgi:octaprenyl-diphosphate synthase